ncbi:Heterokaryon incompatibility protein 6 OR allele [Lachnellula suecica]|uniref:Heterokaryon incompatibility protein 6 OR allele n=1 Tax=Lachnellula suecica TaxID=602035 RepID=A0A8T9CJD1_9HELO|nr:Heterokaryon incompatibility protein 6 OR allele [Lachnellula suecica]
MMCNMLFFILFFSLTIADKTPNLKDRSAQPRKLHTAIPARQTGDAYAPSSIESIVAAHSPRIRANVQIPFIYCPEEFGNPPKLCSQCGGDSLQHGICNNLLLSGLQASPCLQSGSGCGGYYCACTHEGEDHQTQLTSTISTFGQAGTVIFEPVTLSGYASLRVSTTVTLTEVATTTDGASSMETALVVIFAGGLAWLAVSESGAAGAIAAISPPSQPPEDAKDNDSKCPSNPEEDCQNCGGADQVGLCSSGPDAGCPCEEVQHCPNQPPLCTDTDCGGDNGNSQCSASGAINGCLCCPSEPPDCTDANCLGTNEQACTAAKWDKCGCMVYAGDGEADLGDGVTTGSTDSSSISSVAAYVFTTIWKADYSSVIGWPVASTDCSIVTTTWTSIASGVNIPPIDCWCTCGPSMEPVTWGTSKSSTSSWCQDPPTGWSTISGTFCTGLPTSSAAPAPAPTTTVQPLPTTAPPKTTATSACDPYCDRHGLALCYWFVIQEAIVIDFDKILLNLSFGKNGDIFSPEISSEILDAIIGRLAGTPFQSLGCTPSRATRSATIIPVAPYHNRLRAAITACQYDIFTVHGDCCCGFAPELHRADVDGPLTVGIGTSGFRRRWTLANLAETDWRVVGGAPSGNALISFVGVIYRGFALPSLVRTALGLPRVSAYKPLTGPPDAIRVISLQPAPSPTSPVQCRVIETTWRAEERRKADRGGYTALSYTWGDATRQSQIELDGRPFDITRNLELALRHIRSEREEKRLWVDSLCINQEDIGERNQQVAQMRLIYSAAKESLIFLGSAIAGSDALLNAINISREEISQAATRGTVVKRLVAASGLRKKDLVEKAQEILWRSYWRRIWIFQEIVVSHDPWVQYGTVKVPWEYFCQALIALLHSESKYFGAGYPSDLPSWNMASGESFEGRMKLLDLLVTKRGSETSDSRDMVFAISGLAARPEIQKPMEITYDKSTANVYASVVRYILENDGSYEILSHAGGQPLEPHQLSEIPSWAPNCQIRSDYKYKIVDWTAISSTLTKKHVRLNHAYVEDLGILACVGDVFDTIESVSDSAHEKIQLSQGALDE